jgi:hypothetical protein
MQPNCPNYIYYNQIKPTVGPSNPNVTVFSPEPGEYLAMIFIPLISLVLMWEFIIYLKNQNWRARISTLRIKLAANNSDQQ